MPNVEQWDWSKEYQSQESNDAGMSWYTTQTWNQKDWNSEVKKEGKEETTENDNSSFMGDLATGAALPVLISDDGNAEHKQASGSTDHEDHGLDTANEPQAKVEETLPLPGVEEEANDGPDFNPRDFKVTKHGWMNYCVLLCAAHKKERWHFLERAVDKLSAKPEVHFKIINLGSHIQKWGDTGPRRLGFDFD